ncbi:hypothetical protein JCM15519_08700 [Fundidesulfovibrio butyratiphilus]
MEDGQQKRAGLAAAGARLHHEVQAFQQIRQGLGLHGHEPVPAGAGHGLAQGLGKVGKGHFGQGFFRLDQGLSVSVRCMGRLVGGACGVGVVGIVHNMASMWEST